MTHSNVKYRQTSRYTLVWVSAFIFGNIAGIGAATLLGRHIGAWAFAVAAGIILGSLGLGFGIIGNKVKVRRAEIGRLLTSKGFRFTQSPTLDSFGSFNQLVSWGGWDQWLANNQIKWMAVTETTLVIEREWTTGDNISENYQDHVETVGVTFHPNCQRLTGYRMIQERRQWVAFSPDNAQLQIAPALQEALAGGPYGEWWSYWNGWARCCFPAALDANNLKMFLDHIDAVVQAL